MGSSASITQLSANDIGNFVGQLDGGVAKYKDSFIENGIDGHLLLSLDDEALVEILKEIGVSSILHQRKLHSELNKMKLRISNGANNTQSSLPTTSIPLPTKLGYDDVEFREEITVPPSVLMTRLFAIQGIACDPTDLEQCIIKLTTVLKNVIEKSKTVGIKPKEFDCFLNYRVDANKDVAQKLY